MMKISQEKRIWDSNRTFIIGYLILLPSPYVFDMFNYAPYVNGSLIVHYFLSIFGFILFSGLFIMLSGAIVEGKNMDIENRKHTFQDILPIYFWAFIKCIFFCLFLLVIASNSDCIDYKAISCFYDDSNRINLSKIREMPKDYNIYDFFFGLYNLFILFLYQAIELHTYIFYKNK